MKARCLAVAAALALTACTTDVLDPSASPTPGTTASSPSETPLSDPSPSASPTTSDRAPASDNPVQPGAGAPGSVASLAAITPDELGVALIAVDGATGTVSWWDGFGWQSFDVDAALDNQGWATDGAGGLLVQDFDGRIFHLEPYTDEPTLLLEPPPTDTNTYQSLVGGGRLDGRRTAYVEQATYDEPDTSTGDLLAFDLDGRADRTLLTNTAGWESGTGQVAILDDHVVMTVHAECFTFVIVRNLGSDDVEGVVDGQECEVAISGVGETFFGPAALAVVESIDTDLPATFIAKPLEGAASVVVASMPQHDESWYRITSTDDRSVVSSQGVAVVHEQGFWRRLEVAVPGVVAVADDLAIG